MLITTFRDDTWEKTWPELSCGHALTWRSVCLAWPYPFTDIQSRHFQPPKVNGTHSLCFMKGGLCKSSQDKREMRVRCNRTRYVGIRVPLQSGGAFKLFPARWCIRKFKGGQTTFILKHWCCQPHLLLSWSCTLRQEVQSEAGSVRDVRHSWKALWLSFKIINVWIGADIILGRSL